MQLSDEWRLDADKYCFSLWHKGIIVNKKTQEGVLTWQHVGFYGTIEQAEKAVVLYITRDAVAKETWGKFVKAYKEAIASVRLTGPEPVVPALLKTANKCSQNV